MHFVLLKLLFYSLFILHSIAGKVPTMSARRGEVVVLDFFDLAEKKDLSDRIAEAFGKDGLGILTVKNVPNMRTLRGALLPLARRFAVLDEETKAKYVHAPSFYSFGWSHGKEKLQGGKPDSSKGSYYANPIYDVVTDDEHIIQKYPGFAHPNIWPSEDLPELEPAFKNLGKLIIDVGILVAYQCDLYVKKCVPSYPEGRLARLIETSKCAKARLLHYFPKSTEELESMASGGGSADQAFSDWCGWHNDHGSLTGLTPAMFLNEDTGDEVQNTDANAGLYIMSRASECIKVGIPADHIAFQIGECAQVHSGGALQATPHAVRGTSVPGIARDTFAVFMEPMWDEPMKTPDGVDISAAQSQSAAAALPAGVPPLSSRWEERMDFGEFTEKTLQAYY